ncbi:MAG: amidohydrolase family protein [Acidobacteriota bacterium]|nr:amidohydrolase family protein [Acidobacteriota bacterium]
MRIVLAGLAMLGGVWAQSLSIEEYTPKSTLVVPQHPVTRAKYPFIDVHNHQQSGMAQPALDKLVAEMDKLNLRVMVNLSGGYGDKLKQGVANMKGHYPDRFVVFANIDFTKIDDPDYSKRAAGQFEQDIKNGAQGLKIFKNFGMDLKDTKGQRIHVDDPRFDEIFETCARLKVPVLIHTGEPAPFFQPQDKNNERWLELKTHPNRARPPEKYPTWETLMTEQHNLFAKHPRTIFVNAHLGWLGNNLAELGRLMDKLPNMYTEIGAVLAELGRQPRFAREFFIQHQDRVLFGKDVWAPVEYHTYFRVLETADEYFDYYRRYHAFWQMYGLDLPDDVLKKLYYKNALRIIPGLNPAGFP